MRVPPFVRDQAAVLAKVRPRLGRRRRAQALVVLDVVGVCVHSRDRRRGVVIGEVVEEERSGVSAARMRLYDGRDEGRHKVHSQERRPLGVEHVGQEPLDVRAVDVLVGHDQGASVAQRPRAHLGGVRRARLQPEDALQLRNLRVGGDRAGSTPLTLRSLPLSGKTPYVCAPVWYRGEARDRHRLCRVSLGQDQRTVA